MNSVESFRDYLNNTVYIVSCRFHTGAYVSKRECISVMEHYSLLTPDVYTFVSKIVDLGEFLTEEEIKTFNEKHSNYLTILKNDKYRGEKDSVSNHIGTHRTE